VRADIHLNDSKLKQNSFCTTVLFSLGHSLTRTLARILIFRWTSSILSTQVSGPETSNPSTSVQSAPGQSATISPTKIPSLFASFRKARIYRSELALLRLPAILPSTATEAFRSDYRIPKYNRESSRRGSQPAASPLTRNVASTTIRVSFWSLNGPVRTARSKDQSGPRVGRSILL